MRNSIDNSKTAKRLVSVAVLMSDLATDPAATDEYIAKHGSFSDLLREHQEMPLRQFDTSYGLV